MRYYTFSIILTILTWLGSYSYIQYQDHELKSFCYSLPTGLETAEVRQLIRENGYPVPVQNSLQMTVSSKPEWFPSRPSCKIFFNNRDRTLEFRAWQDS